MTGGRSGTSRLRTVLRKSPSVLASVRSWEEFRRHADPLTTTKAKGDAFEALVKAYLLLEPEYASKLKHVWLHCEVPRTVAEKLKLPGSDKGIDLVAETNDGEFWAVQCK
jgi:predicted helicase